MNQLHLYMRRALELAQKGLGYVSPNPLVGCIIVHEEKIIGEGWHQKFGEAHAEVNAISSVENKKLLKNATLYVTLEPCSHQGKTPPCADLLIKEQFKEVVICNEDPNPLVNGKGIQKLRKAGIKVSCGVLEEEGKVVNKRFFTSIIKKRPYIILKWAQTADGYVANSRNQPIKISGDLAQIYSHKWRSEEDAIMVGSQTAINDNPRLNCRHWKGRDPIRILLDPSLSVKKDTFIYDQSVHTYILNTIKSGQEKQTEFIKFDIKKNIIKSILSQLSNNGIQSLLVEGGPRLHDLFIQADIFDEIRIFKNISLIQKKGISAAHIPNNLIEIENQNLRTDKFRIYSKNFQPF